MEKNKFFKTLLVLAVIVGIVSVSYYFLNNHCTLDGESVCINKESENFRIEDDASLTVQVENEELGEYLIETWAHLHPENKGAIETVVEGPLDIQELSEGLPYDLMLTNQNNASYFINDLRDLGDDMREVVGSRIPSQLEDAINLQGYYFVQNSIDGWAFLYNETLLKEMGFDMQSSSTFGLPDSLDSWEKIFDNSDKILKEAKYVFPLTFKDQDSFYPFLTGGRWQLNYTNKGSQPEFGSREFLEGLHLIEAFRDNEFYRFKEIEIDEEDKEKKLLPWMYEEAFYNRESPFTILHSSMQLESYEEKTDDTYKVAPFPKFKDHHLSPMGSVNGYMLDKLVPYPSAGAEVIRILRSPEALEYYKSSDQKVPVYSRNYFDELNFDDDLMREVFAYNYHDTPSVLALDYNPNKLSKSLYEEVNFMDVFEDIYLDKLSVEEAQAEVLKRAIDWLDEHEGSEDEVTE